MTYLVYDLNLIDQTRITGPYLYGRDVLSKSDASSVATIPADGLNATDSAVQARLPQFINRRRHRRRRRRRNR